MQFYDGPREPTAPFFTNKDRQRPYTYSAASADLKTKLVRVSPDDTNFGLHGARVTGYNAAKMGDDEEMAVAQGGWRSSANSRYERFSLSRVLALPARMLGEPVAPPPAPTTIAARPVARHPALQASPAVRAAPAAVAALAPDGSDDEAVEAVGSTPPHTLAARAILAQAQAAPRSASAPRSAPRSAGGIRRLQSPARTRSSSAL